MRNRGLMMLGALITVAVILPNVWVREQRLKREAGLVRDSLEAVRDTTRRLTLDRSVLHDSLSLYQRRVLQVAQENDSLDRALRVQRKAKAEVTVAIAPIEMQGESAPTTDSADIRVIAYRNIRRGPVTIDSLFVRSPPLPAPAAMWLWARVEPIPLGIRLQCGLKETDGIRPAHATVRAPRWATARIDSLEADPDVCNPPAFNWWTDRRTVVAGGLTLLAILLSK